jgi:hypothetical protein
VIAATRLTSRASVVEADKTLVVPIGGVYKQFLWHTQHFAGFAAAPTLSDVGWSFGRIWALLLYRSSLDIERRLRLG